MDLPSADELRMLRARAYGPSADIGDDPDALDRLRELEESLRTGGGSPVEAAGEAQGSAFAATSDSPTVESADASADAAPAPPPVPPKRGGVSRGVGIVWAASVIIAAAFAATASLTFTIIPVSRDPDVRQIDTLEPVAGFEWPTEFFGEGTEGVAYEFRGMTVLETNGSWFGSGDTECITVVSTEEIQSQPVAISGPLFSGCREGAFPATVQFTVDETAPSELRDSVAPGSALQFVLDGQRVGVYTDSAD